jgi:diphthamide synthase (EF-2-diphthine--ammonia ligase)
MHGIRHAVLRAQAESLGLPLIECALDWPSSNAGYEAAMAAALREAQTCFPGLDHCAFGDLFLADVRAYREAQLARAMIEGGLRAHVCCVDTQQLDARFAGRGFDETLLRELPDGVDPCGEHGEFHTCVSAGPMFDAPIDIEHGETVLREGRFAYADFSLVPALS